MARELIQYFFFALCTAADDANTEEDVTPVLDSVVTICQSDKIGEAVMSEGASCGPVETPQGTYTNIVPATLQFYQQIVPQHEKAVFATQPKLRAHDSEVSVVCFICSKLLNNPNSVWIVHAD